MGHTPDEVPPGAIDFYLVRHGESIANREGRWQGQSDSRLSPTGDTQAATLAARFARVFGETFDHYIASDLTRARSTGEAVARKLGVDLTIDPVWREIDVGDWEGLTHGQVAARFPEQLEAIQHRRDVKIGGGESWVDLAVRASRAIHALKDQMQGGQRAAIFAHGGVIASLVVAVLGIDPRRPRRLGNVDNTALTVLRWENDRFLLRRFNDATHLQALGSWGSERKGEGASIVTLVPTPRVADASEFAEVYAHGDDVPVAERVTELGAKHRGRRVALQGEPSALHAYVEDLLGAPDDENVRALPPSGLTHVVTLDDKRTLADYNAGD